LFSIENLPTLIFDFCPFLNILLVGSAFDTAAWTHFGKTTSSKCRRQTAKVQKKKKIRKNNQLHAMTDNSR
jgi:hypothetical protein